jgi:retinol dehydrogenase-12
MKGKICLVTGATAGIGRVTALELARQGARLVLTTRDEGKGDSAASEIRAAVPGAQVEWVKVDLSVMREVREAAAEIRRRVDRLDVMVNNAGAIFIRREVTSEGVERTLATNHLSYFLLTRELRDLLVHSAPARIVNVASDAHRRARLDLDDLQSERGYSGYRVYGGSKLANILFTRELARRLAGTGVTANALHPGVVATNFGTNTPGLFRWAVKLASPFFIDAAAGARTSVYLASSPQVQGKTGGYYQKCREVQPSRRARDDQAAADLWTRTEALLARLES